MKVGSLFAGVGGFDIAAERAGMEVAWQSEVDRHASNVLEHYWPGKNLGDINEIRQPAAVDVLSGGFPCQSYSIGGQRGGLAEDRGALWWQYLRLIEEVKPKWVLGENVPGLLSSNGGRDFTAIVQSLVRCGYGVAWRILDAQNWGVPQQRKRVFILGHSRGIPRSEILDIGYTPKPDSGTGRGVREAPTGESDDVAGYQIQAELIGRQPGSGPNGLGVRTFSEPAYTLSVAGGAEGIVTPGGARRLTPLECERLQGFPDGWTDIPGASDSQRYKQMGNAVAVPVVEWIMRRLTND